MEETHMEVSPRGAAGSDGPGGPAGGDGPGGDSPGGDIVKHDIVVTVKREFDYSEEPYNCTNPELGSEIANQPVSTFDVNSGNRSLECSTHDLDVKPDIPCTDTDGTLTVANNYLSESENEDSDIKKEPDDFVPFSLFVSPPGLHARPSAPCTDITDTVASDHIKQESEEVASNEAQPYNRTTLDKSREADQNKSIAFHSCNITNTGDNKCNNNEPDEAITINSGGDRSRRITIMEKYLKVKVVLADCFTSLLNNKCYCAQCAVLFPTTKAYSEHYMSTHTETTNSTKASAALVTRKKLIHTADTLNECETCKKIFRSPSHLKTHMLIHTGETPFECEICKKRFSQKGTLNQHKLIHTGYKPFNCETCQKTFRQLITLNQHKLIHTGEKPYECNACKKRFSRITNLDRHKLIHTGNQPFLCEICEKAFAQINHLNRHKLIHTGEKPYECKACSKRFTQIGHLKSHELIHTGEKPFECDICKKTFNRRSNLNSHKLMHTGENPRKGEKTRVKFECEICKKSFNRRSCLNKHKLIHIGVKPFECETCKKRFRQTAHLNSHKLIHTGVKPFECEVCKKRYSDTKSLNRHKLIHIAFEFVT